MSTDSKAERSSLKEFIAVWSIATISGDLSNITAPPFILATQSTVEFLVYWAEHPEFFLALASEPDPAKRAFLVLRWFLTSLKTQQYGGRSGKEGVKKPLDAFLGELFLATGDDGTKLISEQVSHHPPVTACYLWKEQAGISAEGYACQEISFNGTVYVKQIGHAILYLERFKGDYLIPLPDVKIKGILTRTTYPELEASHYITSSSDYVAKIKFSGKGLLGGKKHHVHAALFEKEPVGDINHPLFTISGQWTDKLVVYQGDEKGDVLEIINVSTLLTSLMQPEPLEIQDPWESRKAWAGVIAALNAGDRKATVKEKSIVENAQRSMRKIEEQEGVYEEPLFFTKLHTSRDPVLEDLAANSLEEGLFSARSGMWKFDREKWGKGIQKPYHGDVKPVM